VLLGELVQQDSGGQMSLFDPVDHAKHERLMSALDAVNTRFGRNTVRTAAQTIGGSARLAQQNRLSPSYTTKWKEALTIQVGHRSDFFAAGRRAVLVYVLLYLTGGTQFRHHFVGEYDVQLFFNFQVQQSLFKSI